MNRREALRAMVGWALGAACAFPLREKSAARAIGQGRRCSPVISGPLWWLDPGGSGKWGESEWRNELDDQRRLGFNLLWLVGTSFVEIDRLQALLDLCAKRKLQVILDTGSSPDWYSSLDLEKEIQICKTNIIRLGNVFKGHPAFYAWYLPHEIYMCWGEFARYIDALYPTLVNQCKKAADLPVTVSPFFILDRNRIFGDFRFNEPDEYQAYWTRLIRKSGFDVIMLQDSGEHFSYVTNEDRRPFFRAMRAACDAAGACLWGNVETAEFECPSIQEYIRRYGRVHHSTVKNAPFRPVPIDRLKDKLDLASEYCERIVTWGYKEYCRPTLGAAGRAWYDAYRDYLRALDSERSFLVRRPCRGLVHSGPVRM